jgi:hypothetical protein
VLEERESQRGARGEKRVSFIVGHWFLVDVLHRRCMERHGASAVLLISERR